MQHSEGNVSTASGLLGTSFPPFFLLKINSSKEISWLKTRTSLQNSWKKQWAALSSQSSSAIRKSRIGGTFFPATECDLKAWIPQNPKGWWTPVQSDKEIFSSKIKSSCPSLSKIFSYPRRRRLLLFRLVILFNFGLWAMAKRNQNKESLLAAILSEQFLISSLSDDLLRWICPFGKMLLFLLSQGMNQNRNSTLNWVLSNFLPLQRRKPISLCRQRFRHTQASRAGNNNPTTSSFPASHIIVTCSQIAIKKKNFTLGCLEKSFLSAPLGSGWCWQASKALFISNIYISISLHR